MSNDTSTVDSPVVIPTNREVAERIGLTHSAVSRIRSGQRFPGIEVMGAIARVYGWPVNQQVDARVNGVYADLFELAICNVEL
jgi:transcriptional regulator with XRE-family HTH domain